MNNQSKTEPIFENLIGVEKLSQLLNVPIPTIRDWRYKGQIPYVIVGLRLVRFRISDVQKWLDERNKNGNLSTKA